MMNRIQELLDAFSAAIREEMAQAPNGGLLSLGEEVASARHHLGWTLDQLAAACGMAKSHIWQIEKGNARNPTVMAVSALAKALGVPFDRLVAAVLRDAEKP